MVSKDELQMYLDNAHEIIDERDERIIALHARIEQLEKENGKFRATLHKIERNAPKGDREPSNPIEWSFWLTSKVAADALSEE